MEKQYPFVQEIDSFLLSHGIVRDGYVIPVPVDALTPEQAVEAQKQLSHAAGSSIFVTQDRWMTQRPVLEARLLAHHGIFRQVYARNCDVRRIDKPTAASFLAGTHSYADASCKYRYGLFLKRSTGEKGEGNIAAGTLVAVSEFSSARNWKKGDRTIRSFEWVRYASLPGIRVVGGMGKILKHFISEIGPDDIMSYADLEWSDGEAYRQLGFVCEGRKDPVLFRIDTDSWTRTPLRPGDELSAESPDNCRWFMNWGSLKYRLKLVDY